MLFNSYDFIFFYLVSVLFLFWITPKQYRMGILVLSSIYFYAQWDIAHLVLLITSVTINYSISYMFGHSSISKKILLIAGITINLLPLVYFKYFTIQNSHILPLAISFYTFQQITYLIDSYKSKIKDISFGKYVFFVMFFPQLIAGPIVHYNTIITQISQKVLYRANWDYIYKGIVLFCIGLAKKTLLADTLLKISDTGFDAVTTNPNTIDTWQQLIAYSFGIYLDFSAYSDMAIGLAFLFGIKLPINFNAPYKSTNIIEFWRRWHITLSTFLKDYIYIPLGGNQKGDLSKVTNLMITMIIGGIWHGAGIQFVLWGFGHGVLLSINHIKKTYLDIHIPKIIAWFMTFVSITLLWVLFRSESLAHALAYYHTLFIWDTGTTEIKLSDTLWILSSFVLIFFMPTSSQIIGYNKTHKLSIRYAVFASLLFVLSLKSMAENPPSDFIYFNF